MSVPGTKIITIPLRDFALPSPRTGSIEAHSGYSRSTAEGQEIHLRVQKKRAKADPLYQSEVNISCQFDRGSYSFRIDGRMDGFFRHDLPRIEEIKSAFNLRELSLRLHDNLLEHPYGLQLLTYGYFYWREHQIIPKLNFHLVSSRNGDAEDIEATLDVSLYECWLEQRLDELVLEAGQAEKRAARRRRIASIFVFPFENPRPGQIELMETIEEGLAENHPLFIQAPTGLGKTAGVLYPVLKDALSRGQRVVYVTPKNSQHSVAEDAVARFQDSGARVKSLSITAKSKICLKEETLCNPGYCEYARDYYAKLQQHGVLGLLGRKKKLKARLFRELGEKFQICPFELQLDSSPEADVIICDYNYVFSPRSAFGRLNNLNLDQDGKPNLVIDEAHNLPSRAMDYYSPQLSSLDLEKMRIELEQLPPRFRHETVELLEGCLRAVAACCRGGRAKPHKIEPPQGDFLEQDARLRAFLSRYLESDVEIRQQDVVLRLCFYWAEFTDKLEYVADPERPEFFASYHPDSSGGTVKITCCDASAMLRDCYAEYQQVVAFSATLKPFAYYAGLSGINLETVRTEEFQSPFPKDLRKLLIIPQISTRYSRRERNYSKIAEVVQRVTALCPGNYFVFLPSFEFMERVFCLFQPSPMFKVLKQERGMPAARVAAVLEQLRLGMEPTIMFAVQGGSFSEGVDYAGDMVIGAFVVGPPLPNFDLEREQMREYYQARYNAGFEYAYTIPAMAKAIQAAGRVIRSESDRGLIVLMDQRFVEPDYSRSMPSDWFEADVHELVSGSILKDVADFWARHPKV